MGQQKTTRESEIEKFYYLQVLEKVHSTPPGAIKGGQGMVQAEGAPQDMGHTLCQGPWGGVFWGSPAKAGIVTSNQKEWGFGKH